MTTTAGTTEFSTEELNKALFDIDDLMDAFAIPYVLLGDTAYAAKHRLQLEGNEITVGARDLEFTRERLRHIPIIRDNVDIKSEEITYDFNGITIRIKRIKKKYRFIKNPDSLLYNYWNFNIPNSFDKYWKIRGVIR